MNTPIPDDKRDTIKEMIFRGQKIEAIKLYRQSNRGGLAESKKAIEELEKELRATNPENFGPPVESRGCLGILLALSGFIGLLILWLAILSDLQS